MDKRLKSHPPAPHNKRSTPEKPPDKKAVQKVAFGASPLFPALVMLALTFIVFLPVFNSDFISTWKQILASSINN